VDDRGCNVTRLRDFVAARPALRRVAVRVRALYRRVFHRGTAPVRTRGPVPWGRLGEHERRFRLTLPTAPDGRRPLASARVVAPVRCVVPRALAEHGVGGFERDSVATFLALCDQAQDGAVLDIGANTGHYAFLARVYSSRSVVAFEPVPELAAVARRLGTDNRRAFPVEEMALSDTEGHATFYLSDGTDSSSSLRAGFRPSTRQIEVPLTTLDAYVAGSGLRPAVLKIDTETTEPDVVRGGLSSLATYRPWFICEVLPNRGGDRLLDELLAPLGYRFYRIGASAPRVPTPHLVGEPEQYNWLFAPQEPEPRFWAAVDAWGDALSRVR
jgi:FkbM family methyltransferase